MTARLIRGLYNLPAANQTGCVLTIGNYDGIHRGHQALLQRLTIKARQLGVPSVVMTFEPQPLEFFAKEQSVPRLTRLREKLYYLAQCGVDQILSVRFNQAFASISARQFAEGVLGQTLRVQHVIVGEDFHFGQKRQGDIALLTEIGQTAGFTVEPMPSVLLDDERISSTRIRKALMDANLPLVEQLLGRPYSMMGRVVYGDQRGRTIGFPTANINLHRRAAPLSGVYVVRLYGVGATGLPGVANIGVRPTVCGKRAILEVHLFDFEQMIYGRDVRVEFCKKIRDEKRFDSFELLKEQIWLDATAARDYFENIGELAKKRVDER